MMRSERLARLSHRAEKILQLGREERAHRRNAALPFHRDSFVPVAEILSLELEGAAFLQSYEVAQLMRHVRCAVRCETHHLELVTVKRKSEELRHGRIEHTERVGIRHL